MSQNKLEEYRNDEWSKRASTSLLSSSEEIMQGASIGWRAGFDAAIALDLPVKFAEWLALNGIKTDYKDDKGEIHWTKTELASHQHKGTTKDLYQYWIDNVYKPE